MRRGKNVFPVAVGVLAVAAVIASGVATQATLGAERSGPTNEVPPPENPSPSASPTLGDDPIYRLYLSPHGSDDNSGRTPQDPLLTLAGAHDVLTSDRPTTDVEVRIAQGTYVAPPTMWQFYIPGHSISFMPADYDYGEGIADIAGRPVFHGNGSAGWWFSARLPAGHPGGNTNLRFYYLQVESYARGGLVISGGITTNRAGIRIPANAGANRNTILGMVFRQLGSRHSTAGFGYAGLDLVNSSDNRIHFNLFDQHENTGRNAGLIHGVYLAHGSQRNIVSRNRFSYISGGPIHARNDSNNNEFAANTFERAGTTSAYYDWFCDARCVRDNPGQPRECPSHGNVFRDNQLVSTYRGNRLAAWGLKVPGNDNVGGPGCDNGGQKRIRTFGNT